jgi:hypothetical protein
VASLCIRSHFGTRKCITANCQRFSMSDFMCKCPHCNGRLFCHVQVMLQPLVTAPTAHVVEVKKEDESDDMPPEPSSPEEEPPPADLPGAEDNEEEMADLPPQPRSPEEEEMTAGFPPVPPGLVLVPPAKAQHTARPPPVEEKLINLVPTAKYKAWPRHQPHLLVGNRGGITTPPGEPEASSSSASASLRPSPLTRGVHLRPPPRPTIRPSASSEGTGDNGNARHPRQALPIGLLPPRPPPRQPPSPPQPEEYDSGVYDKADDEDYGSGYDRGVYDTDEEDDESPPPWKSTKRSKR